MKKLIIPFAIILTFSAPLISQSFIKWTQGGWGIGLDDAHPAIIDIDSDGLLDLFVGNYGGHITHFEQTAISSNSFSLVQHKFNNIDVELFATPAFADIDKDGLIDLIIGEWKGNLHHYEQVAVNADSFLFITEDFNGITVESNSSPFFTDLDQDGLLDLLVGAHSGNLFLYEQEQAASENFVLLSDSLEINPPTSRINPSVIDLDQDGLLDLIVGGNFGDLSHFEQIAAGSIDFETRDLYLFEHGDFMYGGSSPCFSDFDNDGLFDLIVGEMDGLYYHFEQSSAMSSDFKVQSHNFLNRFDVGSGAAPCLADLDHDGLWDLIVGEWHGNLNHFKQTATGSMNFELVSDTLGGFDAGDYSLPAFADLDSDGLLDLIVGEREGNLNHLEQDPETPDDFNLITEDFNGIKLERYSAPCFTDLDGDGLIDMIVGENIGKLHLYEQQGPGSYEFDLITDSMEVFVEEYQPIPYVLDYDDDGLQDLFVGEGDGTIKHYEQIEVNSVDFELISDKFENIDVGDDARIAFGDINQDGLLDLISGDSDGGLHLFVKASSTSVQLPGTSDHKPDKYALYANYPNPFHLETSIQYQLPVMCDVSIIIYNLCGQKIKTLFNGEQAAGRHVVQWDATDQEGKIMGSGVYVLHMNTNGFTESIMLSLIK